jgi:hypothetical protein
MRLHGTQLNIFTDVRKTKIATALLQGKHGIPSQDYLMRFKKRADNIRPYGFVMKYETGDHIGSPLRRFNRNHRVTAGRGLAPADFLLYFVKYA